MSPITIHSHDIYVEETALERARAYVTDNPVLGELDANEQAGSARRLAAMMTGIESELLLVDEGKTTLAWADFLVHGFFAETLLLFGTKRASGVEIQACVMDTEEAHKAFNLS